MRWRSTGLTELDLVLGGGLAEGSTVIVAGVPGTGKTILAQQICFAGGTPERKAIYYTTLSEPHSKLVEHLASFQFFDAGALGTRVDHVHLGDLLGRDEEGLTPLVGEIVREALDTRPAIMVIDSVKMLRDFVGEVELRMALYDLTSRIAHTDTVLLMVGEYTPEEMNSGAEFSLADAIVQLSYQPREPVDRRWLRVLKMRGASPRAGKHTLRIGPAGLEVFPRIETLIPVDPVPVSGRQASGVRGLDDLLGGGLPTGDASLVLGPSGVGKTIFSLGYLAEGLARGEHCLYITFQDTVEQLAGMAGTFGWDFRGAMDAGRLSIEHVPMGSLDLDLLASVVRGQMAGRQISRVVIDSLAEMASAAGESVRFAAYLRSLIALVRVTGASLLVTTETTTLGPGAEPLSGHMFLFHNVIYLRYLERDSVVDRAINVVKMRNSTHDPGIYRAEIGAQGMKVGAELSNVSGVLGWTVLRQTALEATSARPTGSR